MRTCALVFGLLAILPAWGASLVVRDSQGNPLPQAMVTSTPAAATADLSDDGYAPHGVTNTAPAIVTRFTDASGRVSLDEPRANTAFRVRAQGFVDSYLNALAEEVLLQPMTAQQLPESYPSNQWLSQLSFGGDEDLKKRFQLNCAYCHQQASPFMRNERSEQEWLDIIKRMNSYGGRLPDEDHQRVAQLLRSEYRALRENPHNHPAAAAAGKRICPAWK